MSYIFSNNASALLTAPVAPGDLTISIGVPAAAEFPQPGADMYPVTLQSLDLADVEICRVTNVNYGTGVLTVVRAQEGTTAASFSTGAYCQMRLTAAELDTFIQRTGDAMTGTLALQAVTVAGTADFNAAVGIDAQLRVGTLTVGGNPGSTQQIDSVDDISITAAGGKDVTIQGLVMPDASEVTPMYNLIVNDNNEIVTGRPIYEVASFAVDNLNIIDPISGNSVLPGKPVYLNLTTNTWDLARAAEIGTYGVGLLESIDPTDPTKGRIVVAGAVANIFQQTLVSGFFYYVSFIQAGLLATPDDGGSFENPILLATGPSSGILMPYRGSTGLDDNIPQVQWGDIGGDINDQLDLQAEFATKEDLTNKAIDFSTINDTLYPTVKAVEDQLTAKGYVTDVTATAPLASSGTDTPDISITQADTSTDGYLSSTDWNTFNNKLNPITRVITVSQDGNSDYTSVAAACDFVATQLPSQSNPYEVLVYPGVYTEPQVNIPTYTHLVGSGIDQTVIEPDANNHHVIAGIGECEARFLSVRGSGAGYANIFYEDQTFMVCHKVSSYGGARGFVVVSNTTYTDIYLEYCDADFNTEYNFMCVSTGGFDCLLSISDTYSYSEAPFAAANLYTTGVGAQVEFSGSFLQGCGLDIGIQLEDGAAVSGTSTVIFDCLYGIRNTGLGAGTSFKTAGSSLRTNTYDVDIQNSNSSFAFVGRANPDTFSYATLSNTNTSWSALNTVTGDLEATNALNITFNGGTRTEVIELLQNQDIGVISGGILSAGTGKSVNFTAGVGYYINNIGELSRIAFGPETDAPSADGLTADMSYYVYYDTNGALQFATSAPATSTTTLLGRVTTDATGILLIDQVNRPATNDSSSYDDIAAEIFGPLYVFGSIITAGTGARKLSISSGKFYVGSNQFTPSGGVDITFVTSYSDGGTWYTFGSSNLVPNDFYDDGSGTLAAIPAGEWVKHAVYIVGDGADEQYFLQYATDTYATDVLATAADLPVPPSYVFGSVVRIGSLVIQEGGV